MNKLSGSERGLYEKYTVINNKTGKPVKQFTFTLSPEKDPAAVAALQEYIKVTTNRTLAEELKCHLESILRMDKVKCDYCGKHFGELRSSPYTEDGEMCSTCWKMAREALLASYGEDIGEF
ncbi:hypothetical protein P8825_14315 [Shouchella clausii]|uniref:hypothetical protein n=1 Tax=Shouchella clausii TaxID=79880 RepID=UPI002DB917BA|nr:hypothetical protein [Shouchella clausii]MEB5480738.1 hypothetical protein [Shouchella clausii]